MEGRYSSSEEMTLPGKAPAVTIPPFLPDERKAICADKRELPDV
jgi:hypothetical protein